MEEDAKVFSSDITRGQKPLKNHLYELLKVVPAVPTTNVHHDSNDECDFQPKTDKIYVPKRRTKPMMKVLTVRDIRKLFEIDVYPDLSKYVEKQQNYLLKNITSGSFREERTKSLATSILKCDKPISRTCWQMLMNLNPQGCVNPIQYVLWNGRCIRVNGSKGGKNKFLCNYDLEKNRRVPKTDNKKKSSKRPGLLRNSLSVKFKPGPLSKKRVLDDSHQKFNVGDINIVNLPRPGLDIQPKYGIPLEPTITNFVHSLRDVDGAISEKWAEFSVSVLGAIKNKEVIQNNNDGAVSFELNYQYDQRQLLMRRDFDACEVEERRDTTISDSENRSVADVNSEVELILSQIINSVEISLQQDSMYTGEDEEREVPVKVNTGEAPGPKEKHKKRFAELGRLDVTVIRLPEAPEDDISKACNNAHCSLGCVCSSLQRSFKLKQHCGRLECMFQCKCDFSKYKNLDFLENDCAGLLPGLINLDKEINYNLAKEEQKFHQTVVMTAEKSIVLKSEKRNWKATKRYSNFYDKMCLKSDVKRRELLAVVDVKLNLENVEPWCMVHNMYKCFCKGVFTQDVNLDPIKDKTDESETTGQEDSIQNDPDIKLKSRTRSEKKSEERNPKQTNDITNVINDDTSIELDLLIERDEYTTCARTKQYEGRKYPPAHYMNANKRIIEMEANDDKLRKRMDMILNRQENRNKDQQQNKSLEDSIICVHKDSNYESHDESSRSESLSCALIDSSSSDCSGFFTSAAPVGKEACLSDRPKLNHTTNKNKLIAWLEASYKQYKKRVELGVFKKSLEPPKHGKVALYPWEFILNRYKEKKNLFLVSKEKPFRIFMAVDAKNSFFNNCMNIDDIRFAELYQYPATVRNLLTNATDLKDNFCILCGWSHCWELIGSVTKVDEQTNATNVENSDQLQLTMMQSPSKTESHESIVKDSKVAVKKTNAPRRSQRKRIKKRKFDASSSEDEVESVTPESSKDSNDSSLATSHPVSSDKNVASLEELTNRPERSDRELLKETSLHFIDLAEENKDKELSDTSKWFVMTVENDFSEIQFFQRGFFVKYESIIKAINVARLSGKTVRLSSQKSSDVNAGPQFGIYAVPNADEYYVFIGPYEKNEPLGIETVTTISEIVQAKRTKGVWIFTKKMDNIKVIDNPLAFMPSKDLQPIKLVHIEEKLSQPIETTVVSQKQSDVDNVSTEPSQKDLPKVVKPIKIRKTNGFYQLASGSVFKTYGPSKSMVGKSLLQPFLLKNKESNQRLQTTATLVPVPNLESLNPSTSSASPINQATANERVVPNSKPVAEIAPQIKIVDVFSQASKPPSVVTIRPERGMLVLKPEEINKRVLKNIIITEDPPKTNNAQTFQQAMDVEHQPELDQDIENFLATSSIFIPPNADIFEISDDDDEDPEARRNGWSTVWIDCVNIKLGYLRARRNADNRISFEFPGFKFTDFYEEQEAFSKINQVLSRKIYVPKKIKLQWRVVENAEELRNKKKLNAEQLGPEFALTRQGLRHKRLLLAGLREEPSQSKPPASPMLVQMLTNRKRKSSSEDIDKAIEVTANLDEQSNSLEEEGDVLFSQMVNAHGQSGTKLFEIQEADQATLQNLSDSFQEISETG